MKTRWLKIIETRASVNGVWRAHEILPDLLQFACIMIFFVGYKIVLQKSISGAPAIAAQRACICRGRDGFAIARLRLLCELRFRGADA